MFLFLLLFFFLLLFVYLFIYLIGHFIHLHFKYYHPSQFPLSKPSAPSSLLLPLWGFSPIYPPTHASSSYHHPSLGHQTSTGPRAFPLINARWSNPLVYLQLETWIPSCVLFGWWFSLWELWGYWLIHIVLLPVGLQTPPDPLVLSLASPLGTLCSVQ